MIIPSIDEPFGLVGLEGMAMGKPIISSQVGGLSEFLKEEYSCSKILKRDKQSIIDSVLKLIKNDRYRKYIGKNAKREVEKFSWKRIILTYIRLYKEVYPC